MMSKQEIERIILGAVLNPRAGVRAPKFMTVLTRWDEQGRGVEVRGTVAGSEVRVLVTQSKSLDTFEPKPPIVNMPAIGGVREEHAREMAKLTMFAANTARRMGAVKDWARFRLPAGWPTAKIPYVTIGKQGPWAHR